MDSQKKLFQGKITFRPAAPSDANLTSRLIFETFPKMATYLIGLGDARLAKDIIAKIFPIEGHRFSYQMTELVCSGDAIIGMFIAYPGRSLTKLGWSLAKAILKLYPLRQKLKLIQRGLPLIFIQEAARDEYLLSNLAVKRGQRGQGIGAEILSHVEKKAHQIGYHKLAVMVDIDNKDARRFYERHGYAVQAMHLEPNQRVKHLGPGYLRLLKELD
jgi:GNAT superfamily N-acetyltransferase